MQQNINLMSNDEMAQIKALINSVSNQTEAKTTIAKTEIKELSQYKKNLLLLEAAKNLDFNEINQLINTGADINSFQKAYPNLTFFNILLDQIYKVLTPKKNTEHITKKLNNENQNSTIEEPQEKIKPELLDKCIEIISFLLSKNALLSTRQSPKEFDTSEQNVLLWKNKWAQIITKFPPTISHKIIEKTQQLNLKTQCAPFIPQKTDLFEIYLQSCKWNFADMAQKMFFGTTSIEIFSKFMQDNFISYNFSKSTPQEYENQIAILSIFENNKNLIDANTATGMYNCALRSDNPKLLLCALGTGIKPENFFINQFLHITTTATTANYFNKDDLKTKENLKHIVFVAIKNNATECTEIFKKIPFIMNDFINSSLTPSDIGKLQLNQIKIIDDLGYNIDSTDSDNCNFLHHLALNGINLSFNKNKTQIFNNWKQIIKWKPQLVYQKDNSEKTPLDIFTKRIKFYHENPIEALEKFNKEISLDEAKELKKSLVGTIKKRKSINKNRL